MFSEEQQGLEARQQVHLQHLCLPHDDGHHIHLCQHVPDTGGEGICIILFKVTVKLYEVLKSEHKNLHMRKHEI